MGSRRAPRARSDRSRSGAGPVGLEADFVLPDQFLPCGLATPEKRLLLAVLEEAVGTYQRHVAAPDRRSRAILADVEDWLACEDGAPLFSFVGICETLGIEPAYVRAGLALWTVRHRTAAPDALDLRRLPLRRVNGTRRGPLAHPQGPPRGA